MKRFISLFVCGTLLLATGLAATANLDKLQNGMHPQRGGNIYIETPMERTRNQLPYDAAIYFHDPSQKIFTSAVGGRLGMTQQNIEATQVADIIAQSVAAPVTNTDFQAPFVRASLVEAASTNVFVGIHGFGTLTADRYKLPALTQLVNGAAASGRLVYNAEPRDPVAVMQTLASGAYPSRHGIVGSRWVEANPDAEVGSDDYYEIVDAYSSETSQSLVPSVGDRISEAFSNEANVLAASGNGVMGALAFAQRDKVSELNQGELFLDKLLNSKDTLQALSTEDVSVTLLKSKKSIVVQRLRLPVHLRPGQFADAEPVTFDLNRPEVAAFFAELLHFNQLTEEVVTSRNIKNVNAPSFYSFVYTAFPGLTLAVGDNFRKVEAAAAVVDAHVAKLLKALEGQTRGHTVAEIAFLGSTVEYRPKPVVDRRVILSAVKEAYPAALEQAVDFYPLFFVPASQVGSVCADLTARLMQFKDVRVVCAMDSNDASSAEVSFLQISSDLKNEQTGTFYLTALPEGEDVNRYQIVLWTFIILFFATCYAVLATINMEFKKDQSLWGTVPAGARH